jgi:hypothetical protein
MLVSAFRFGTRRRHSERSEDRRPSKQLLRGESLFDFRAGKARPRD